MSEKYRHPLNEAIRCISWIRTNYPDCIKFNADDASIKSIAVYLEHNRPDTYCTMIMMYGVLFTLGVLEYMIEIENYEKCKVILDGINRSNSLCNAGLPTTLHSKWVSENINLTPSQMLEKHFKTTSNKTN